MPQTFYSKKGTRPVAVPDWPLGLALKTVLFSTVVPIVLMVALLLAAVYLFPESKPFLRDNTAPVIAGSALVYYTWFITYLVRRLRARKNLNKDLRIVAFPVRTTIKYIIVFPFVYFTVIILVVSSIVAIANALGFSLTPDQLAPPAKEKQSFNWLLFVGAVVFAPILEEIVFRGMLLPAFVRKYGWRKGSTYSSLIFAVLHGPVAPFIFIISLYLSRMYYRTASIIPGIVLHMLNNAMASLVLLK